MGVSVVFEGGSEPVELVPGQETELAVRVRNTGQVVDRIVLNVLGDTTGYSKAEPGQVNLLPGATERVSLKFSPPRAASLAPGPVPFGLRALSTEDPEGSSVEEGLAVIGEFSDLSAQLVPRSATGRRSAKFRLVVENRGNRPEPVRIEPLDPDDKLGFKTRPAAFTAPPGTATFVRARTIPKETFFRGPNRTLPFQVAALPERGEAATGEGAVVQKQLLPTWLLPALGVLVLVAGAAAAIWFLALRPIVNSAATGQGNAARAQAQASKSAKAAKSAKQQARKGNQANAAGSGTLTGLTVRVASPSVLAGATDLATAAGTTASGMAASPSVVWTSSNPSVATVSPEGLVQALTPGAVTITATSASSGSSPSAPAAPSVTGTPAPDASSSGPAAVSGSATVSVVKPVSVTTASLPQAVLGRAYSQSLSGTGGTGTYTWSVGSGSLPAGFTLSPAGILSGTGTAVTAKTFKARLVDEGPPYQSATRTFTFSVIDAPAVKTSPLSISTPATLPQQAVQSQPFSLTLAGNGGTQPYTWSLASGSLPSGLSLNSNGTISGTPATAGQATFTVKAVSAGPAGQSVSKALTLTVVPASPAPATALDDGTTGETYSQTLSASFGTAPYTLASGNLPPGLNLSQSGVISGTPAMVGTSTFAVQAADPAKPGQLVTQDLSIMVASPLSVSAPGLGLPDGVAGARYSQALSAPGGKGPYTWSVSSGALPAGLTLDPASGRISGTPSAAGSASFVVKVADSGHPMRTASSPSSSPFTLTVVPALTGTSPALPPGAAGDAYTAQLTAAGGTGPYVWTPTGTLPKGLTLSASGQLSGTPAQSGTFSFSVQVTDSSSPPLSVTENEKVTVGGSLQIITRSPLAVSSQLAFADPLPAAAVTGQSVAATPTPQGGSGSFRWSEAGALPDGLRFNSANGEISGTVAGSARPRAYPLKITLTDGDAGPPPATEKFTLTIVAPLAAPGSLNLNGAYGSPLSQQIRPTGGLAPYTYAFAPGDNVPSWLSVGSTTGLISGTPDTSCASPADTSSAQGDRFTCPPATVTDHVTVTDATGETFTVTVNLTVTTPALTVKHATTATQRAGQPLSLSLGSVQGGYGGGRVTYTAAGLPCSADGTACDQLNSTSGKVTGTLLDFGAGSYNIVVTVTQDDPAPGSSNTYIGRYTVTIKTASGS